MLKTVSINATVVDSNPTTTLPQSREFRGNSEQKCLIGQWTYKIDVKLYDKYFSFLKKMLFLI